jgi:outer membrane biogenesis lipoprotein LolB
MKAAAAAAIIALLAGCRGQFQAPPQSKAAQSGPGWRQVGSWSGHGDTQTESFSSDSGTLRVRWKTTHEPSPGGGQFRLTAHSAISGRTLQLAVESQGTGQGTSYVNQDPHVFYMVVESADLDWAFTVEEAVPGT